eukprot:s1560_g4.t1
MEASGTHPGGKSGKGQCFLAASGKGQGQWQQHGNGVGDVSPNYAYWKGYYAGKGKGSAGKKGGAAGAPEIRLGRCGGKRENPTGEQRAQKLSYQRRKLEHDRDKLSKDSLLAHWDELA